MKIRQDFVTNSSSSSFIIGKKEDESVSIESVYQTIKGFYRELLGKRDALIEHIQNNPKLNLEYYESPDSDYCTFQFKKGAMKNDKDGAISRNLERDFGVSTYDYFQKDYSWMECKTYKDYENYWIEKMKASKSYSVHAPFTIVDFLEEKTINWLHWNQYVKDDEDYYYEDNIHRVDSKSDTLGWYFPYAEEAFDENHNCETCRNKEWCDSDDKKECEDIKSLICGKKVPEKQACLHLLGRVCIHSESGYIPDYIVKKLKKISEYSCNHMG